jgi:hypothetical protein
MPSLDYAAINPWCVIVHKRPSPLGRHPAVLPWRVNEVSDAPSGNQPQKRPCPKCDSVAQPSGASWAMLYFNNDEEQTARVEKMWEELHRKPAAPRPASFVLLIGPPPMLTPKPKLTLVAKSK